MKSLILPALLFLLPLSSSARWAEPSEAAAKVNFERVRYKVRADGTFRVVIERQLEILKESARAEQGMTRLTFDARSSDFELEEAKTINPGGSYEVRREHIEVKPLASAGPGFDEQRQMTIAFPRVEIGSKLYYRYVRDVKLNGVKNLFSETYPVGWNELVEALEISYDSALPLHLELHDPEGHLEATREEGGRKINVRLKRPVLRMIVQENRSQLGAGSVPWVSVSTAPDWASFPPETPALYEKVLGSELPAAFLPLVEKAKKKTAAHDQIDAVTSGLRELVRYVGDWQQIEGAFHPRPLQLVADTGFGDCKDYTSVTAAVLRRLGFTAHAAWVGRGEDFEPAPTRKIAAYYFNHAIVHARKDGKEYWIDPTNEQSFSRGIFQDIAGKPAFVLEPGAFRLAAIPPGDPATSLTQLDVRVKVGKRGEASSEGSILLSGGSALTMTAQGLSLSKSQLDYSFLSWITDPAPLNSWKFSDYELKSRIVSDIRLTFSFDEVFYPLATTAGEGYQLPENPYLDLFRVRIPDRAGDLVLDRPSRWKRTYRVSGRSFTFRKPVACSGKSPWVDFSRRLTRDARGIIAREEVTLKRARATAAEVASPEFAKLIGTLFSCLQPAVAIY